MITDEQLRAALQALPHEHVTPADIERRIAQVDYIRLGATITVCHMTLDNGFSVRGESGCVDPRNYNRVVGEKLARERAVAKLFPLFGFLLAEARHVRDRT